MSAYSAGEVYTRIVTAMEAAVSGVACYSRYTEKVESFPAAFIYCVDMPEPSSSRTLAGDSCVWEPTVEVQLFSNKTSGARAEAKLLANAAIGVLKGLHFRIGSLREIPNGDPSIYRLVFRATRIIGAGDEMPSVSP